MIRRPPRSTRTDTLFPYPTLFRSDMLTIRRHKGGFENLSVAIVGDILHSRVARSNMLALKTLGCPDIRVIAPKTLLPEGIEQYGVSRSEERRVGKECVSTCRSRWSPYH